MSNVLPDGWVWARIADVTERVPNVNPVVEHADKEFGYVDISAIDNSTFSIADVKRIKGVDAPSRARRPVRPGDVLFSNVRTYLRNIALVPHGLGADVCSTGITVLRANGAVLPEYLFRYVLTNAFIDKVTPQQTGTHYPATSDRIVMAERIPLPPISEQRRIVAKLEQLLEKVAICRQHLGRSRALLHRFRQAVLSAACSGRLTADWRKGQAGSEPAAADAPPPSWRVATVGEVVEDLRYGTAAQSNREKLGTPVLRIPNIGDGVIDQGDLKRSQLKDSELKRLSLIPGDVLLIRSNGSASLVGRAAIVRSGQLGFAFAGYLIRLRPELAKIEPEFLNMVLRSPHVRLQIDRVVRSTSGVHNINGGEVRALTFALPPRDEQREIALRVSRLQSLAGKVEARLAVVDKRIQQLQLSALKAAFRGELDADVAGQCESGMRVAHAQ